MEQTSAKRKRKSLLSNNPINHYHPPPSVSCDITLQFYVLGQEIGSGEVAAVGTTLDFLYQIGLVFDKRDNHRYYGIGITQYRG